jgi:hypothetical protein
LDSAHSEIKSEFQTTVSYSQTRSDGDLFLKNPAPGKAVSHAQNCLNDQIQVKKSVLTIKPASVISLGIGSVYLMSQYVGPAMMPIHN